MTQEKDTNQESRIRELASLLYVHKDKRVVVVGTTCTGKSTFLENIPTACDMDKLVFPLLTEEEAEYVCQTPWTSEIGKTMDRLVKEKVIVEPGKPVFGTIVLDSDLIIYLRISDELLRQRTASRNVDFEDAKNMQTQIERDITQSKTPVIEFDVR